MDFGDGVIIRSLVIPVPAEFSGEPCGLGYGLPQPQTHRLEGLLGLPGRSWLMEGVVKRLRIKYPIAISPESKSQLVEHLGKGLIHQEMFAAQPEAVGAPLEWVDHPKSLEPLLVDNPFPEKTAYLHLKHAILGGLEHICIPAEDRCDLLDVESGSVYFVVDLQVVQEQKQEGGAGSHNQVYRAQIVEILVPECPDSLHLAAQLVSDLEVSVVLPGLLGRNTTLKLVQTFLKSRLAV